MPASAGYRSLISVEGTCWTSISLTCRRSRPFARANKSWGSRVQTFENQIRVTLRPKAQYPSKLSPSAVSVPDTSVALLRCHVSAIVAWGKPILRFSA
jgi:hypothetical protein